MNRTVCLLLLLAGIAQAGRECVWILGRVQCEKNPAKNLNVEVRVLDKDGMGVLQLLDPDDLMGVTFSNEDGSFQLDGYGVCPARPDDMPRCADDFDWLPGVKNVPEPYIEIRHYCNSEKGETLTLPEISTFVPETYELGLVKLDREDSKRPRRR